MYYDVIMAGFGGQGIMLMADMLALIAMKEGKNVTWMPAYGVEMRGGTANCTVIVSSEEIGSPVTGHPYSAIVMNEPSLMKYEPMVRQGGFLLINTSLIDQKKTERQDIEMLLLPANDIAHELGNTQMANMVALGAFIEKTKIVSLDATIQSLPEIFPNRPPQFIKNNTKAMETGAEFAAKKG
ncbi:MAG: 2-oxoacid:acceptor oxidoreductase family protein [Thermodesulfobacteriota bacterium]|nr:2-oxoacid:acceptor oxidoreductase family protein [Thermodesulfobacteriota bacterium]